MSLARILMAVVLCVGIVVLDHNTTHFNLPPLGAALLAVGLVIGGGWLIGIIKYAVKGHE